MLTEELFLKNGGGATQLDRIQTLNLSNMSLTASNLVEAQKELNHKNSDPHLKAVHFSFVLSLLFTVIVRLKIEQMR